MNATTDKRRYEWQNDRDCLGPECTRKAITRGMCNTHYQQFLKGKDLTPFRPRRGSKRTHKEES